MSSASSTLPDAMIDLVDRLIDAADRRGWRRRGKSAGGLRDAGFDLVMARNNLIAALDVPAAWRDVAIERRRQTEAEGWSAAHDDRHRLSELAVAGAAYAYAADFTSAEKTARARPEWWPFDAAWWKPGDQRRMLVKAAALILAEIERLDRAAAREAAPPPVPTDPTPLPPQAAAAIAAARAAD